MKRYQITIGGRRFEVRLLSDPHRDRVEVEVDGQPLVVDVQDLDMDGSESAADLPTPVPDAAAAPTGAIVMPGVPPPAASAGRSVAAPLPGVVKSIAVQPGQRVDPGDVLLVIEAMKMDNVIRASRRGVIDAIHIVEGHRVAHGDVMIEYRE